MTREKTERKTFGGADKRRRRATEGVAYCFGGSLFCAILGGMLLGPNLFRGHVRGASELFGTVLLLLTVPLVSWGLWCLALLVDESVPVHPARDHVPARPRGAAPVYQAEQWRDPS